MLFRSHGLQKKKVIFHYETDISQSMSFLFSEALHSWKLHPRYHFSSVPLQQARLDNTYATSFSLPLPFIYNIRQKCLISFKFSMIPVQNILETFLLHRYLSYLQYSHIQPVPLSHLFFLPSQGTAPGAAPYALCNIHTD